MTSDKSIRKHTLRLGCKVSNNEAEHEALLTRLRVATKLQVKEPLVHYESNSMLIVNQVKGDYTTYHPMMGLYLAKAKAFLE